MQRRIEIIIALLTPVFAAIGLAFAIFGPATFSYGTNWIDAGPRSMWDAGLGSTGVLLFLIVVALAAVVTAFGFYLRGHGDGATGLTLLWGGAIVLLLGAVLTLPGQNPVFVPTELHTDTPDSVSIGIYLVPAVAMAFLTALVGSVIHHEPTGTERQRPPSPA